MSLEVNTEGASDIYNEQKEGRVWWNRYVKENHEVSL